MRRSIFIGEPQQTQQSSPPCQWRNDLRSSLWVTDGCSSISAVQTLYSPVFWERLTLPSGMTGKANWSTTPFRGPLGICGREVGRGCDFSERNTDNSNLQLVHESLKSSLLRVQRKSLLWDSLPVHSFWLSGSFPFFLNWGSSHNKIYSYKMKIQLYTKNVYKLVKMRSWYSSWSQLFAD